MKRGFTTLEIKRGHRRNYKFLTGFTLIELVAVVVISAILLGIIAPIFTKAVRRMRFKEVGTISDLTVTAARYYDFKCGINSLNVEGAYPQGNRWQDLNVEYPQNTMCAYEVKNSLPGNTTTPDANNRGLVVFSEGSWLYRYDFEWEDGVDAWAQGEIKSDHSDKEYIERLDLPGV